MKNIPLKNVIDLLMKVSWSSLIVVLFTALVSADNPEFFHTGANLQLSAPVPGLLSVSVRKYDNAGDDKSIGFKGEKYGLTVTVYVYPKKAPDIFEEVKGAVDEIQTTHPNSQLVTAGTTTMMVGRVETSGTCVLFLLREGSNNLGSFLYVFPQNDRYLLKVRATYRREPGEEGEAMQYTMKSIAAILSKLEPAGK